VFAELKKKADGGDSAAVGMRKVTKDMKTKYRKKEDGRGKVQLKKKAVAQKKPSKPPSLRNMGGRWMVENYFEGVTELPDKISVKQNAFIVSCQNCAFIINQKIKAITLDSCKKVTIQCNSVVSVVELVNCKSVTLIVQGIVPSIQIDKCSSPRIVLQKAAMNPVPKIITSNISAGNVEIPGATEDDDPIEIPLPEQYVNTINMEKNQIDSVPMSHG
jgi:adenylyl cyclase-associated protein